MSKGEIGSCHPLSVLDLSGDPQGFLCMCKPSAKFTKGGENPTRDPFDVGLAHQRVGLSSQAQRFHDIAGTLLKVCAGAIRCFGQKWASVRCTGDKTGGEPLMITQSSKQCYRALEMLYGIHPIPIYAIGHSQQVECFCHALGIM